MTMAADASIRALIESVEVDDDATAEEATTSALRQAIIRGILRPGERLRQERLAAEFGVSRIPLRDAFRRLEAEGLIRIEGRRGARVASLSIDEVAELYELRRILELHCLRLAVRNMTDADTVQLVDLSRRMDVAAGHASPAGVSRRRFYMELYRLSGMERTAQLIIQFRHELNRYQAIMQVPVSPLIHEQIRACIETRDAEAAARHMRDHIRRSRDELVAAMRREQRVARSRRAAPGRGGAR